MNRIANLSKKDEKKAELMGKLSALWDIWVKEKNSGRIRFEIIFNEGGVRDSYLEPKLRVN